MQAESVGQGSASAFCYLIHREIAILKADLHPANTIYTVVTIKFAKEVVFIEPPLN